MQKIILIVVLIIIAIVFIAPRLWKGALHEETGSTRTKLPSFNDYDNSKFPDRDKLLLAAEYLKSVDPNGVYFVEAKESTTKKITQYVGDLDVVLGDIKKDNKTNNELKKISRKEGGLIFSFPVIYQAIVMRRAYDTYQMTAAEPSLMLTQDGWANLNQVNRYVGLRILVGDFVQELYRACGAEREVVNEIIDAQRI